MKTKNSLYLVLTVILVILSIIGGIFLFQIIFKQINSSSNQPSVSKIELIPTDSPQIEEEEELIIEASPTAKITSSPIASPTSKIKITPTIKPTATLRPTATPTSVASAILKFDSSSDGFSVSYSSSRKLYQDKESSGNRYTFYLASGNFAVHVGLDDKWAWTNSSREFTNTFTVASLPTFRYDIANQTIVDLQSNGKNYTIQCVHNGKSSLKTECEEFIASFQLI